MKHPIDVGGLSVAPGGKGARRIDARKEQTGISDLREIVAAPPTIAAHQPYLSARPGHAYAPPGHGMGRSVPHRNRGSGRVEGVSSVANKCSVAKSGKHV